MTNTLTDPAATPRLAPTVTPVTMFMVYPSGSVFGTGEPHGPRLVLGTTSKRKAVNAARRVGGTVEMWIHGQAPVAVEF